MRITLLFLLFTIGFAQYSYGDTFQLKVNDTVKQKKENPFKTGYYSLGFFDVDLRYFIKYNNYESFRLGTGGITNERLFENFKVGGYVAYGFKDKNFKYSIGGNLRLHPETNTWWDLYYTSDISEIGSFAYLTDARVYSVFEPRRINVIQFYKYRTWQSSLQHEFSPKILSEVRLSRTKIDQIEDYQFVKDGETYRNYHTTEATLSFRFSPKTKFVTVDDGRIEYFDGFPKISAQVTQGIKDVAKSDFNYTKLGLKLDYYIKRTDLSSSNFLLEGMAAFGDVPLTHLFHAYPNAPTKDEILQRFSVAGTRSFETMYFGEFFSDHLITFQGKHSLRRFYFSDKFKPELVFITRHALGNLNNPEEHLGIPFNTLNELYSESGFELNRILFGFGLSFAYRYGFYHLPDFEDNISFKFTFNLKI
ncbi:DUF5686 family protein [Aureisphaera galaxeae]|uniref:DUF5686 family protein n=1 Tax=Aureisphaera galaxeae TaxID=1538023 RepID=UPI0023505153|nr:DUF5686 family protein [Aureisphaera galaxeae]MDC8005912.1 DUF5686 family protein [Aureisphaera galaxeae]